MKVSVVTAPGEVRVVDAPTPTVGPADVLVKIRACGICGSDAFYITLGGMGGHDGGMPLGHEPAGEVADVGRDVTGIAVGDHVVINPMAAPWGHLPPGGQGTASSAMAVPAARSLTFSSSRTPCVA